MKKDELVNVFEKMAPSYDQQWEKLAPINSALHLLMGGLLARLPEDAKILCVGAGTGAEILYLAERYPNWHFVALDPSAAMIDVCKQKLEHQGFLSRCEFHVGFVETFCSDTLFDAATAMLVSQFITNRSSRIDFFKSIGERLKPGALIINSDLSADTNSPEYTSLLATWFAIMENNGVQDEGLEHMRKAYEKDVGIISAASLEGILVAAGFGNPLCFYQAALIRAWCAYKSF